MNNFHYLANELCVEQVPISQIIEQYGTPCYIYSRAELEQQWRDFDTAFKNHLHRICYSVKANSNLAILNTFAKLGAGFDIVSGGELARVLAAGGKPEQIVFSGVGKTEKEINEALAVGVFCFNVESKAELQRLDKLAAKAGKKANVALRINPEIDPSTHPHITTGHKESKFGIPIEDALDVYLYATTLPAIKIKGIATHIGSQILTVDPFMDALDRLLQLVADLKKAGITLQHLDIGGGLGIPYHEEKAIDVQEYADAILQKLGHLPLELLLEPGRALVADAGILVARVEYLKHHAAKNFVVVDAGMNDLIRPALYDSWHGIIPVKPRTDGVMQIYDVVGPVCESADFLGKNHHLQVEEGDLIAICTVGAYGFVMSSNYNTRPRAAEVLVDKDKIHLVRRREEVKELFADEKIPS